MELTDTSVVAIVGLITTISSGLIGAIWGYRTKKLEINYTVKEKSKTNELKILENFLASAVACCSLNPEPDPDHPNRLLPIEKASKEVRDTFKDFRYAYGQLLSITNEKHFSDLQQIEIRINMFGCNTSVISPVAFAIRKDIEAKYNS